MKKNENNFSRTIHYLDVYKEQFTVGIHVVSPHQTITNTIWMFKSISIHIEVEKFQLDTVFCHCEFV
jgi:hypothetical protein